MNLQPMNSQAPDGLVSEINALTEVAKTLAAPLELPELLNAVMRTLVEVVPQADLGAIMLWDQTSGVFRPAAAVGYDLQRLDDICLRPGESITGKVYEEGQPLLLTTPEQTLQAMADLQISNRQVMTESIGSESFPQSAVAAAIKSVDRKFGVLVLESLSCSNAFSVADLGFVQTLADLVALAIDRARLAEQAAATRATRQVDQERSELLAALSHELRMPLATIKGYATALLMDSVVWEPAKQKEFLQLIEAACNDMEGLLKDILDTSLIGSDKFILDCQPLHLPQIAAELANELRNRSRSHQTLVDFPPGFPRINADPKYIKQVFRNILDNAVKYSPQGGLIVIRGETLPDRVVVSIADQGIGIASADMTQLFEKYFRVRAMETAHIPGSGLGLPLARAYVEAHGGRIWVESKIREGTTVHFSLPIPSPP